MEGWKDRWIFGRKMARVFMAAQILRLAAAEVDAKRRQRPSLEGGGTFLVLSAAGRNVTT